MSRHEPCRHIVFRLGATIPNKPAMSRSSSKDVFMLMYCQVCWCLLLACLNLLRVCCLFQLLMGHCHCCSCVQLFVRRGDEVFRDEVIWDVSNPQNTADTYAIRVCADLGLSCDWYDAITGNLKSRIEEVRQVSSDGCLLLAPQLMTSWCRLDVDCHDT